MIRLPRLLDSTGRELARLHPVSLQLTESLAPLSSAVMTLPADESAPEIGQLAALYTPRGSAGIFRVQQLEKTSAATTRVYLEHGLVTLADSIIPGTEENVSATVAQAAAAIMASQSLWVLDQAPEVSCVISRSYGNALECLLSMMKELPGYMLTFDQSSMPWRLSIIPCPDDAPSECRLTRNLHSLTITDDRADLCTRLYLLPTSGEAMVLDADTQSRWGIVSRTLSSDSPEGDALLLQKGEAFLAQHKHPAVSVNMDASDLSQATGEASDSFVIGRPCRVCLPGQQDPIVQRVTRLAWPDLISTPTRVSITLATALPDAADMLSGLILDTTVIRRETHRNWNELGKQQHILIEAQKSLTLMAEEINLLADRVTVNAREILLKASSEEVTKLGQRLSSAEISIDGAKAAIALKAEKSVVSDIAQRLSSAQIDIDGAKAAIALKAEQSVVSDIAQRLSSAQIDIDGAKAAINLKAEKATVDDMAERLAAAQIDIDGAKAAIDLKADRALVSDMTQRLSSAEVAIDGAKAAIDLKADKSVVDDVAQRLSSAEVAIDGANATIALKAAQSDVNSLTNRLSAAEILIDGLRSQITLKADKIALEGYVTAEAFETQTATITNLTSGETIAANLTAEIMAAVNNLYFQSIPVSWLSIAPVTNINLRQSKRYLSLMTADGGTVTLDVVTDVDVAPVYQTVNFLGKEA